MLKVQRSLLAHHVRERFQEAAHYGVRLGAAAALASVQSRFKHDLRQFCLMSPSIIEESLIKNFQEEEYVVSPAQKVFDPPNTPPY